MWKIRPVWPASAAQPAGWPRLVEAPASQRHALALRGASGEPAGRRLSHPVFQLGRPLSAPERAPGCPERRPASANQPLRPGRRLQAALRRPNPNPNPFC
eukprot:scaffold87986_cov66-Phaeocystis_antarctica.AAC.2